MFRFSKIEPASNRCEVPGASMLSPFDEVLT
jgi:hypothetical protein